MAEVAWADIAIVGGGMVGLSCAHMLCRALPQATSIQLIEKRAIAFGEVVESFDARSTALSMGSVELLQALDLWKHIRERASPILSVQVSDRGHIGRVAYGEGSEQKKPLGYVVANALLGEALNSTSQYSNLNIISPASVETIKPCQQAVKLSFSDGGCLKAGLLIIADGADSDLRQHLGITVTVDDYRQHAVVANVAFDKSHEGRAFERFTSEGPLALLPLPPGEGGNHTAALVWTRPSQQIDTCQAWSDQQFIEQLQQYFGFSLGCFRRVSKRSHYPLRRVLSDEQVRSNLVLLGNAAHFLHPVAGQGFNLALRDAMQLVDVLTEAEIPRSNYGDLTLLQKYAERQRMDQSRTSLLSHGFNSLFSNRKMNLQLLRNLGLLSLELLPSAKGHFFSQMMGRGQRQVQSNFMHWANCGVQSGK